MAILRRCVGGEGRWGPHTYHTGPTAHNSSFRGGMGGWRWGGGVRGDSPHRVTHQPSVRIEHAIKHSTVSTFSIEPSSPCVVHNDTIVVTWQPTQLVTKGLILIKPVLERSYLAKCVETNLTDICWEKSQFLLMLQQIYDYRPSFLRSSRKWSIVGCVRTSKWCLT